MVATNVSKIGDRVNAVEVAAQQLAARVDVAELSIAELSTRLQNQESDMRVSFLTYRFCSAV